MGKIGCGTLPGDERCWHGVRVTYMNYRKYYSWFILMSWLQEQMYDQLEL